MDNKRNVATKTLLVLSCAFLLGLTSCTKKHHPSSDTTSSAPISETTSESTSETTSDITTSEGTSDVTTSEGTSDSTTSEEPSTDVSSGDTSSEDPSSDVSSEDASSEESSSEEVLLDFGENVKLSDKTVTYNGEEQTLTVENLPQGAVVTYEGTHKFINAGEYTIRATVSKEGYNNKVVSAKLTIAKAKVEVPTAKTNLVYTGETIVGVDSHNLYTVTGGSAVEAGTHEATVTLKDTNNYEWASEFDGKVSYTIAKAEISVSGVTAPEMSVVDTGSAINFVVNGVPSNVKATVTYYSDEAMTTPVSEAKGVGVYFVKVELASKSTNYKLVGKTTLTSKLTIRENNTGVTFAGATFTYDGTEKTIAVDMTNAKTDGDFEVTYFIDAECTTPFTTATNAGTYNVYAKVVDKNQVYSETVLPATLTINKVAVKVVVQNKEVTYNQDAPTFTYEVEGLVNGESAENVIAGNATFTCAYVKGSNVGKYDITLSGLTADNYELTFEKGKLTVKKATYDLSGVTVKEETTYTYDGTSKEIEVPGVPTGVSATVTYYSDAEHTTPVSECKKAGTYYVVVTLTSSDTNYNAVDVTKNVTLTINKAKVEVPTAKDGLKYTGTELVGVEENELYTVTDGSATNAGKYTAKVTLKDTTNYEWANAEFNGEVEFEIAKADVVLSKVEVAGLGEKNATAYSGTVKKVTVTGLPEGVFSASVEYYADAEHTIPVSECKNAGIYYVVVTFNQEDKNNYNTTSKEPVTGELIIKQKVLSVTWTGETEYTYDGTEKTIPTCVINEGQVIAGDEVNLGVYGESTIKFVGEYGYKLALEGAQASNYEIDYENGSYLVSILAPQKNVLSNWSELLADDFTSGQYAFVFGSESKYYALTNNVNTTNKPIGANICESFTSLERISFSNSSIWTISSTEGGYYIKVEDSYLSGSTDSDAKTALLLLQEADSSSVWSIGGNYESGYYFYNGNRAILFNGTSSVGYYATSNLSSYYKLDLYKLGYEEPVTLKVEEVAAANGTMTVKSSTEQLVNLVGSVDKLSIKITPAEHKMLVSLEVVDNNGVTLETLVTTKNEDGTYTYDKVPSHSGKLVATFGDAVSYSLSQSTLENGEISGLLENYYAGETVSFTVTPNSTYYVKNVVVKDASNTEIELSLEDGKYVFVMPESNVTVSVEIVKQPSVTLEQTANGTFVVKHGETTLESGVLVNGNIEVTVVATPNTAYVVDQVLVNGIAVENNAVTITEDTVIKVTYKLMSTTSIADILDGKISDNEKILVSGTISKLGASSDSNSYISDDSAEPKTLLVYKFTNGDNYNKVKEGDMVLLYGTYQNYNGTHEIKFVYVIDCFTAPSVSYIDGTKLVWDGNATSYDIYCGTETANTVVASKVEGNELDLSTVEGLSFTDNTSYVFKVVAHKTSLAGDNWELTSAELSCVYNTSYTITYKYNDDGVTPDGTLSSVTKVTLPEKDPTRTGYVFEGWFTDAACTKAAKKDEVLTGNLVLYAKWKDASTNYKYSYSFVSKAFSTNNETATLDGVDWKLEMDSTYIGDLDSNKGLQFGKSKEPAKSLVLSTSDISGTIKSISINTSGASSINGSFTITIDGKSVGTSTTLTSTATDYTFTCDNKGEIVITFTQSSSKAIYIKSITIEYL